MSDPPPRDREITKSTVNPPDPTGPPEPVPTGARDIEVPETKEYQKREEHERLRHLGRKGDRPSSAGQA